MNGGVLVVMEAQPKAEGGAGGGAEFVPVSLEALGMGRELARRVGTGCAAVVIGEGESGMASGLRGVGLDRVYVVRHPLLERYTADGYVAALAEVVGRLAPGYVVFPHTYQVRDYAPALATRLRRALIPDVIGIGEGGDGGAPVFVRQAMRGKLHAEFRPVGDGPCFVSVQAGAFRAKDLGGSGVADGARVTGMEVLEVTIGAEQIRTRPGERFRAEARTVDLGTAEVIVAAGRGVGTDGAGLRLVAELALALGGQMAASRPVCDSGLVAMDRLVGSSGQTVAPKLYLAVGMSGASQHLVGIKGAKTVIAINRDAGAPIFEVADVGVVGDLLEVVPALTRAVLAAKR